MKINSAYLFIISAAVIWGATAPIMKLALTQIPPFSLAFLRMILASAILGILIYKKLKINKEDRLNFFWAALTGVTLNLGFFFIGLKLTQAIVASFLVASIPLMTILAAHIYLKEKLSLRLVTAAIVAFFGAAIIIGKPQGGTTITQIIGNILLLFASVSWVIHEIVSKKLLKKYGGSTVAFYAMFIGSLTFFPLSLWEYWQNPGWIDHLTFSAISGLIYGIFFSSLVAYWAWQKGLAKLAAGQAAFFFYLDPISGAILSIILLGEKLTPALIVGGILIITGVFLSEHKRHSHPLQSRFHNHQELQQ